MDSELLSFTRQALTAGVSRSEIAAALRHAEWPEPEISAALDAYADIEFPVPVPRPRPYLSARDMFVYLVLFTLLYMVAYNLGALIFHLIDHAFPSRLRTTAQTNTAVLSDVRWNIAVIAVALPLFMLIFLNITRAIAADPTKRRSRPRMWLTYATLFITAVWIVGDIMALVYNALGGEFGTRFLLKVVTVGVIAGGIFTYFLHDVRQSRAP